MRSNLLSRCGPFRRFRFRQALHRRKRYLDSRWTLDQSVLVHIGLYVNVWAGIERMLNDFIRHYHPHRPAKLKTLPGDLQQKIKYLIEVSKDERLPTAMRADLGTLAKDLSRESEYRHILVHGYGFRRRRLGNVDWQFQMIDLRKNPPTFIEEKVTHEKMRSKLQLLHSISAATAKALHPVVPQRSSVSRP